MVEALRRNQVPLLAGDAVEVGQGFGQAAILVFEDHLHLRVGQA
jgi:hypothetical protein